MNTNVVEQCRIPPSSDGAAEQLLPLVYFDIATLTIPHVQTLHFYSFPCSETHFFNAIVPNLKNSLSLALKHFLPLAGKIIFPLNSGMPVSHYASGEDSVALTVAVSASDFSLLTGNHLKDADEFHHFIPEIPPAVHSSDSIKFPVLALQITLFPNQGICIGISANHAIADGAALVFFLQTWASINKFNNDNHLLALGDKALPVYDRSAVQDSDRLTPLMWEAMKNFTPIVSSSISFPTHKLRGTFVFSNEEISKLKNLLPLKKLAHVSSTAVVCARVWSCMAAAAAAAEDEAISDEEREYLLIPVDSRARLSPPLPTTYFGNCLTYALAESTNGRLKGNGGFVAAAEAIGEAIHNAFDNKEGVLGAVERYVGEMKLMYEKRMLGVSGSPRFDLSGVDYGWGRMKKLEALHIDINGFICFCKARDGVEVGISLPKMKMQAFASIFNKNIYQDMAAKL